MPAGKLKATGHCFENAARYITGFAASKCTLVHAIVTGVGPKVSGIDYSHAFIIAEDGTHAIDVTKDLHTPTVVPLEFYRQLGNVRNEIHYTRAEAMRLMNETEHFGPWDDSLETEADRVANA